MLLTLLALAAQPANAGELHVEAPITLVVEVEGIPRDFEAASSVVVVRNLKGGSYQVEVVNAFGKLKAQDVVQVGADEVVGLRYSKKALVETGRAPLPAGGTPAQGIETQLQGAVQAVERVAEEVATEIRSATSSVGQAAQEVGAKAEDAAEQVDEQAEQAVEQVLPASDQDGAE